MLYTCCFRYSICYLLPSKSGLQFAALMVWESDVTSDSPGFCTGSASSTTSSAKLLLTASAKFKHNVKLMNERMKENKIT